MDAPPFVGSAICEKQFRPGENDTVSAILFTLGVGTPGSQNNLYGTNGWIERNRHLMGRHTDDVQKIGKNRDLRLVWPVNNNEGDCGTDRSPVTKELKTAKAVYNIRFYLYRVKATQSLSQDLHEYIQPFADPELRIYGKHGLLESLKPLNPGINLKKLTSGQELIVGVPFAASDVQTPPVPTPLPTPTTEMTPEAESIVANAKDASLDEIVTLPSEGRAQIPDAVVESKLNEDAIAKLDDQKAANIPPAVVEKKAWDYSLMDMNKPGMDSLFKNLTLSTPSGYLGVRYSRALVSPGRSFLSSLQIISVLAEIRGGMFDGLRVMYDKAPLVTGKPAVEGSPYSLGYSKLLLGWAFAGDLPAVADRFHIIPRLGQHSAQSSYSILNTDGTVAENVEIKIDRALSMGLEADIEWSRFFYTFRLWAGLDRTPAAFARGRSAQSVRLGTDLFVKGKGFDLGSSKYSLFYLAFAAREAVDIVDSTSSNDTKKVNIAIPTAGLGIALTW